MPRRAPHRFPRLLPVLAAAALLAALPGCGPGHGTFEGTVTEVLHGDLLRLERPDGPVKVRLAGVDCPERGQPQRTEARQFTLGLTQDKVVRVFGRGRNRSGQVLGIVQLPDGRVLNRELVAAGLAWVGPGEDDEVLHGLERQARLGRRGIWQEAEPVPPWEFLYDKTWRDTD